MTMAFIIIMFAYWKSLAGITWKLQRFSLFEKMSLSKSALQSGDSEKMLVPGYLCDLVPSTIGDRVGYVLRNAGRLDTPKIRLVPSYNSFLPKTIREWNV